MRPRPWLAALLVLAPALAGCAGTPAPPEDPRPGLRDEDILAAARAFDGDAAFAIAAQQLQDCPAGVTPVAEDPRCTPRYRSPGTEGNNATARWIGGAMARPGITVGWEPFEAVYEGRRFMAHNVIAERPGARPDTLYLAAHYDSRPCADKDPELDRRHEPVLGANDGAAGVAVVLLVARLLADRPLNLTLRFAFFDAEDMGDAGTGCGEGTAWAQGSAHHAASMRSEEVARTRGLVLVDMPGDRDLHLRRERASAQEPHRALQDDLWAWARKLGHRQFVDDMGPLIHDDHIAFQQRGIPSVDIIHLDGGSDPFPASHHTTFDNLRHVSPASLEAVGETVLATLLAWDRDGVPGGRSAR